MNIGDYKIGTVVQDFFESGEYGHVVGFSRNNYNELIIVVQWELCQYHLSYEKDSKRTSAVHPSNLRIMS